MGLFPASVSNLGMYPQTVVPSGDDLHNTLTNGMDAPDSGVTATGKHYTANKDKTAWNPDDQDPNYSQELNPVYEYQGERYVRATPYANGDNTTLYTYNLGGEIGRVTKDDAIADKNKYRWFKVEPIKWIVLNYNWLPKGTIENYAGPYAYGGDASKAHSSIELYAADVLVSGIPFGVTGHTSWEGSIINKYLNEVFYNEAFPMTYIPESAVYNNKKPDDVIISSIDDAKYALNSNFINLIPGGIGCNMTNQKICLLSHYELSNIESPYTLNGVFESGNESDQTYTTRRLKGTDYAKAHNLHHYTSGYTLYWTRTASSVTHMYVGYDFGGLGISGSNSANTGTRPALTMLCFAL